MIRRSTIFLGALVILAVLVVVVNTGIFTGNGGTVSGQVVSVEQASLTTISSLTIEDESGKRWTFRGDGTFAGFTPSHIDEHRTLGESITVEYAESDSGVLTIRGISD